MDTRIFLQCICLVSLTLVADCMAKRSSKPGKLLEEKDIQNWRCSCDLLTEDAKLLHGFPDMALPNDLAWQGFTLREQCKDIRHFCRKQCADKMNLHSKTENHEALGYEMCMEHGTPTETGGLSVYAQATLYADDRCHAKKPIKSVSAKTNLCCGHTTIPLNGNTILAYGWNPDCLAESFILAGRE